MAGRADQETEGPDVATSSSGVARPDFRVESGDGDGASDMGGDEAEHFVEDTVEVGSVGESGGVGGVGKGTAVANGIGGADEPRPADVGQKGQAEVSGEEPSETASRYADRLGDGIDTNGAVGEQGGDEGGRGVYAGV